jgi:Domain of unknown function (DUF1707)
MTPTTDRQWAAWFRAGYPDQDMRVSDAERAEVTDRLARHYGDGRLDKAEFDDRVSRAMAAKTAADFQGLFDDLPGDATNGTSRAPGTPRPGFGHAATGRPRGLRRGPVRTLMLVVLAFIAVSIAWHAVAGWMTPLLWLALIGAVIVLASRRARRSGS